MVTSFVCVTLVVRPAMGLDPDLLVNDEVDQILRQRAAARERVCLRLARLLRWSWPLLLHVTR